MTKFDIKDLETIRNANVSPTVLKAKIASMLENSADCRAIVETLNRETGEYRIVLQGTLETTKK